MWYLACQALSAPYLVCKHAARVSHLTFVTSRLLLRKVFLHPVALPGPQSSTRCWGHGGNGSRMPQGQSEDAAGRGWGHLRDGPGTLEEHCEDVEGIGRGHCGDRLQIQRGQAGDTMGQVRDATGTGHRCCGDGSGLLCCPHMSREPWEVHWNSDPPPARISGPLGPPPRPALGRADAHPSPRQRGLGARQACSTQRDDARSPENCNYAPCDTACPVQMWMAGDIFKKLKEMMPNLQVCGVGKHPLKEKAK